MPADPAQRARAIEARRWALPYIRDWIEGDPAGRVHRQEIEHLRAAIRIAGGDDYRGYALLGLAEAILRLAGAQRWDMRGYLVSHLGLPASETEIAAALGVDPQCAAWAIRALSGPRVGLLERVAWPPARPAPGEGPPADGPDGPQADRTTRPPDAGEAAPAQVGDRAKLPSPDAPRAAARARSTPTAGVPGGGGGFGPPDPRGRRATIARGQLRQGKEEDQEKPQEPEERRGCAVVACGKENAQGDLGCCGQPAQGQGQEAQPGRQAQVDAGRGVAPDPSQPQPVAAPAADSSPAQPTPEQPDSYRGRQPAGRPARPPSDDQSPPVPQPVAAPAAGSPPGQPAPGRTDLSRREPDRDLWAPYAEDGLDWLTVRTDRVGARFGMLTYRAMGLPVMNRRLLNRNLGVWRRLWQTTLGLGLGVDVLLACVELGIRKAIALRDQLQARMIHGEDPVGQACRMWTADWKKRVAKALAGKVSVMSGKRSSHGSGT